MVQPQLFHPPITLSELESHLWEAANILRGSPVDRTDWKTWDGTLVRDTGERYLWLRQAN
jgi:hypothetical protein